MTSPTHDLAIARAERELHRAIAGRCEAADQRARSLEAALTMAQGSAVACADELRAIRDLVAPGNPQGTVVDAVRAHVAAHQRPCNGDCDIALARRQVGPDGDVPGNARECAEMWEREAARVEAERDDARRVQAETTTALVTADRELAAIRDLVAPGNPQGTVVDAVRAMATGLIESIGARDAAEQARDMARDSRDAAIARAEAAERTLSGLYDDSKAELAKLRAELAELTITRDRLLAREHEDGRLHAQLRAELAELRARPVLTEDLLRGALDAHGYAGLTRKLFAHLGPVTLPLAELRARPVLTVEAFTEAYIKTKHGGKAWPGEEADRRGLTAQFRATFAALGPVTLPSPDRAEELAATLVGTARASMTDVPIAWSCDFADGNENARRALTNVVRTALAKLSPDPAPAFDTAFLRRVMVATKHGPNGKGGPGPCDAACVKCEAELMAKAAPAREVAPTRVLVHADGGACHGSRVVDGRCVGCGIAPDMQSTSLWLDADARPVQCEPAKVVAPTLVAVSDEELAVAFYSEPERPALRECIDAADLAGIRAVRAKLGAAEVTEERLREAIREERHVSSFVAEDTAKGVLARLRATAAKGG